MNIGVCIYQCMCIVYNQFGSLSKVVKHQNYFPKSVKFLVGNSPTTFQNLKIKFVETPEDPVGWLVIYGFTQNS